MTAESAASLGGLRILFLSHTHEFGPFRVGSHHYARQFALRGAEVVHLSTPISLAHRLLGRVGQAELANVPRRLHRDEAGVSHLIPRTVMPAPLGRFRVSRYLRRAGVHGAFDAVLVDQPLLWDNSVPQVARTVLYRPTDLYPVGMKHRIQGRIVQAADGIAATSSEVLRGLQRRDQPAIVLPNGVDLDHFSPGEADASARENTCVYVGALDGRFDWATVTNWADIHPDVQFLIAGPDPRPPAPLPSNVELLGSVPYDAVPALLGRARIGLLPLSDDPLNAGRSPMKLYEYLAAGLTVLTRETPGMADNPEGGVYAYDSADKADEALRRALAHTSPNVEGQRAALEASWERKTAELLTFIQSIARR